jgi:hypothetical protein
VKRGTEWHTKIADHKKLARAATPSYIRILGDGYRPVSISDANPCGRLLEANKEHKKEIKRCDSLTEVVIQKALYARIERPAAEKPEHQLQAFLIRTALQNETFGRLGRKGGVFFPVFIELKNGREFTRLREQLDNACQMLWQNEDVRVRPLFAEFLSAVSGVQIGNISLDVGMARKIIIWPKSPSGKEAEKVTKAREKDVLIVEFELTYKFSRKTA